MKEPAGRVSSPVGFFLTELCGIFRRKPLDQPIQPAYLRASDAGYTRLGARSSNGKRADSDSVNQGSNPCRASRFFTT